MNSGDHSYNINVPIVVREKHRLLLRLLWVALAILVTVGSLLPPSSTAMRAVERLQLPDKALHFLGYATLAFLPALHESRRNIVLSVAAVFGLGVLLEFGQRMSGERMFEVSDMVANGWGALCGLVIGWPFRSTITASRAAEINRP